jgi:PAS domain S-box-containing protein
MITVLVTLIQNAALLLAMMVVFDLVTSRKSVHGQWRRQAVAGLILGGLSIGLMLASFTLETGIIFDTRSVLLSLSGLFLGPLPTAVAMVISSVYRLVLGGVAALPGTGVILATGAVGILWRRYRTGRLEDISVRELYLFGVVVHILMLAILMTLPWDAAKRVIAGIGLPVMLLYPVATIALGWLLANRLKRENASLSIRDSEQRYRALFESANVGKSLTLPTGEIKVNQAFCNMLGYTQEELQGKTWQELTPPEEIAPISELLDSLISGEKDTIRFVKRYLHKNGTYVWADVSTALRRTENSKPMYFITTIVDITEGRLAEEKRLESEYRFRKIFEDGATGMVMADKSSKFIMVNPTFCHLTGYSEEELKQLTFKQITHPNDLIADLQNLKKMFSGEIDVYRTEKRYLKKDGQFFWAQITVSPIRDSAGQLLYFVGIIVDITERKHFQEELEKLNTGLELKVQQRTALLEAANRELEAFSYSVSHDLRAPLRHINGYVDMLNRKYYEKLDDKARHYLDTISGASKTMGTLIDDLLNFSRTGRQELSTSVIDFNLLLKEVLRELEPVIRDRNILWSIQNLPEVHGDYNLLKRVWTNLLDNAVKYTRNQPSAKISVSCRTEKENFVFCVRDNGVGFDMKYAHKLFGVFQRLHTQSEFEGTGIGLANVQRIIHKHAGTVWAESEKGMGASFFFSLPKSKEETI